MFRHLMLVMSCFTFLNAIDLEDIEIKAKAREQIVEKKPFESIFVEPDYYENTEYIPNMPSQKRITKDEAMFIPGVQGDPIKAIQSMSGVTSLGDMSGELFIYGSKPEESVTTLNHLPLGYLFHMGGLHSVVSPESIEQIDAYMAGFDSTYGNAMGGVINVTPAYPGDELSGYGHMGLYDASAGINIPLSDNISFYLGVRRSYFDLLLSAVGKATGTLDEDTNTTYTEFPNYYDVTFIGQYSPNRNNVFSIELISAGDSLEIYTGENAIKDPEAVGNIKATFGFTTVGMRHLGYYDDYESNTLVYYKHEEIRTSLFDGYFVNINSENFGLFHQSSFSYDSHKIIAGVEMDTHSTPLDINMSSPGSRDKPGYDFTTENKVYINERITTKSATLFLEDIYDYENSLLIRYGARLGYTNYNSFKEYLDPRLSILYNIDSVNNISLSTGIYTQMPQDYKTNKDLGSESLDYERAEHYVLHYDNSHYEGVVFDIDSFYKKYYHLAIDDNVSNFSSKGDGYSYGIDTSVKLRKGDYYAFGAYTYMNSKRELDANDEILYRFYGDVPHTLQLIAGKKFWKTWAFSTRMNYHSGTPYTKVIGTYMDNGRVRPIYEDPFSSRLPEYFSLNVKIAQQIKLGNNESLEWSFEIMNLTNHTNVSEVNYDENYNATGYSKQLPLLPWFDMTYKF